MKILLGLIALVGAANCICNSPDYDLNYIIDDLILDTDVNPRDGIISVDEFQTELLGKWDTDNNEQVGREEFVNDWVAEYSDCRDYAYTFFDNMDVIKDGQLTTLDLTLQMIDLAGLDGVVHMDEFRAFVHKKHPEGV